MIQNSFRFTEKSGREEQAPKPSLVCIAVDILMLEGPLIPVVVIVDTDASLSGRVHDPLFPWFLLTTFPLWDHTTSL